jgi:hypothetical protein
MRFGSTSIRVVIALVCLLFIPAAGAAQDRESRWGAGISFTPNWTGQKTLTELLVAEGEGSVEGSQFTVGIVRGRSLGGDWGVSFVRTPFTDPTRIVYAEADCDDGACFAFQETTTLRRVILTGVEAHVFFPVVTIKQRVQVGFNVGGGVARVEGEIERAFSQQSSFTLPNGEVFTDEFSDLTVEPANEVMFRLQPLMKVELQGAVIVHPRVKVKVSWGQNYVGLGMRVGAVVFF